MNRFQPTPQVAYKEFVCTIEPQSSFLTPFLADTFWAALMWTHAYMHGDERRTRDLVHADPPQILVSDGFPYGYLPKPKNFIPIDQVVRIVQEEYGDNWEKQLMGVEIAKRLAEQKLLPVGLVNRLVSGESEAELLKELLRVEWCPKRFIRTIDWVADTDENREILSLIKTHCNSDGCDAVTPATNVEHKRKCHYNCQRILDSDALKRFKIVEEKRVRKNRIDRALMRALDENGLYSQTEAYWLHNLWWVFVRVHPDFSDELVDLFSRLSSYGYGRRKSVGKGQFRARLVEPSRISGVQLPQEASDTDGFMSLSSSYVPGVEEFTESRYTTHIKRGKVDGHLASSGKFMKKPIVMYQAGSVFQTNRSQAYYGRVVKDIYDSQAGVGSQPRDIVQYGYAFPLHGKFFCEGQA